MTIIHRLANVNWIAVVLSPLTVILMEVCWVYPWLAWAGEWQELGWQRTPLTLASLILILSVSFFVTRFFLSQRWPLRRIQLSVISCGLVVILIVLHVEYGAGFGLLSGQWFAHTAQVFLDNFFRPHPMGLALVAAVYLWWRGISLGRSPLYFRNVYRPFLLGLAALVILIIVWAASLGAGSLKSLTSTVGLHVAGFFFFGLTALALGNLQTIRRRMQHEEEIAPISSRRWLPILLGVVGGIVLVGIGTVSIFSSEFVALLARLLKLTFNLLLQALHYLFIPLDYLADALVYIVQFIISLLHRVQPLQPFEIPDFFEIEDLPESAATQVLSAEAILAMKWSFFALVAIVVLFLLARAIFRFRALQAEAEIEEIHESLWSWSGFKADLRLFFSMIWQRFERKRKEPVQESPVPSWYTEDVQGMLGIRQIYRHLLWKASCARIARQRHETPYEYARRLGQAIPDSSKPLSELTNLYIDVRYGDLEAEYKQVRYANSLWKVLQRLLGRPESNQQVE